MKTQFQVSHHAVVRTPPPVNVADREGDLYDLFVQALARTDGPPVHLLVRAA